MVATTLLFDESISETELEPLLDTYTKFSALAKLAPNVPTVQKTTPASFIICHVTGGLPGNYPGNLNESTY